MGSLLEGPEFLHGGKPAQTGGNLSTLGQGIRRGQGTVLAQNLDIEGKGIVDQMFQSGGGADAVRHRRDTAGIVAAHLVQQDVRAKWLGQRAQAEVETT